MANPGKITEIVDDKAFQQVERLLDLLKSAQDELEKAAKAAQGANKELSKAGSSSDLDEKSAKAAKAMAELERSQARAAEAQKRLELQQIRLTEATERRLKKEAEAEAKRVRDLRASEEAEKRFAKNAVNASDSIYDANKKVAQSEKDVAQGRAAAQAAAMSGAEQYSEKVKTNTGLIDEQTQSVKESNEASKEQKDVLDKVAGSTTELIARNVQMKIELKAVQEELKGLNDQQTITADGAKTIAERRRALSEEEAILKQAMQQSNLEIRRAIKEQNSAEGSSDALAIRLDRLRAAWRSLGEEERESAEIGKLLQEEIKELDKVLKDQDASLGVYNRNVGNYKSGTEDLTNALTESFPILNKLKREWESYTGLISTGFRVLTEYVKGTDAQTAAQNAATVSVGRGTQALRLLRVALISTGIGAIVVLLGSLIAYLTSTADGIEKVRAVTVPLQQVMRSLLGVLQNVGKFMIEAFTNPRKAMQDMYNHLKDTLIPQVRGLYDVLAGIVTLDFSRVRGGLDDIGRGMDNTMKSVSGFFGNAWQQGTELANLMNQIDDAEINLIRNEGQLNRLIRERGEVARDMSKSEGERQKAAQDAIAAINTLEKQQTDLANMRIRQLEIEQSANTATKEDLKEMARLEAERDDIAANAANQRIQLTSAANRAQREGETAAQRAAREQQSLSERQYELTMTLIEADQQRFNIIAQMSKRVVDDERNAFDDRLNNLDYYLKARDNEIEAQFQRELLNIQKQSAEATKLEALGRTEEAGVLREIIRKQTEMLGHEENALREQLRIEGNEALLKLTRAQLSDEQVERQRALQQEIRDRETALAQAFEEGTISETQYNLERIKLSEETSRRIIENEIEAVKAIIDANKAKGMGVAQEERQLAELKERLSRQAADAQIADAERIAEREQELGEKRKELMQELGNLATALFQASFERENQRITQEIEQLDEQEEREKKAAETSTMTEEQKEFRIRAIEQRSARERQKLQDKQRQNEIKQARFDRTASILRVTANVAEGITRAFADLGPIAGIPFAASIGAIGAAQIATILATPLPQYFKGTSYSKEGLAHVGERGTELLRFPGGQEVLTPNRDTVTWLPRGTEVLTNEETKRYLAKQTLLDTGARRDYGLDIYPLIKQQALTNMQLKKMQKSGGKGSTILTKNGLVHVHRSGTKWSNYLKRNGL